ncbi:FAD-dependent monooxygenase [Paenibacillus sp. FSL K6-4396]|uniref:FAD-dependent monooxygenase n=1 Tax=unclassified Paenibacillus TaxID=185978 RepID=UPI001780BBF8|nr:FAD-dependent monooxygenase [Paenibacillus sp. CFBP 13594]MBD8841275.1 FAD-dependent monooxygenase [Paenibacillus sp. CFBP 13594]
MTDIRFKPSQEKEQPGVSPSREDYDIDVLVAGAGPTGSTLAADLLRRGLRVRLIDKAPHAFKGSRAKGLQPRTQEVLEDFGVLSDAHTEGSSYPLAGIHLGPITVPWRMQQRNKPTPDVPYPNILLLAQHRTDAILHRLLKRQGLNIEFNNAVDSFEQDAHGVTVTLSTGEKIRSRYLVGADGGSSTVRKGTGIRFIGETNESDRMLIIDGTIDGLSRSRWHMWPHTKGKFVGACPLPHSQQFQVMIRLGADENPDLNEAVLAAQFHKLTGFRLYDITWSSVFRPNVRLAEHYRSDRVFLAGDAAHVHTPAGAQGLNTGVQDAYNLGWKIGQVIAGAPDRLLDSYEAERQPIAARVLGKSSELYAKLDNKRLASLKRGDEERQLLLSYHGGPLSSQNASTTKSLQVGGRAPDAPCIGPGGVRRLFEILRGPQFTLLAFGANASNILPELIWPTSGAKLHRYIVSLGNEAEQNVINDTTQKLTEIYGISDDTLVLIRPDGYIGSIIKGDWQAEFENAVSMVTPPR